MAAAVVVAMLIWSLLLHMVVSAVLASVGLIPFVFAANVVSGILIAGLWAVALVAAIVAVLDARAGGAMVAHRLGALKVSTQSLHSGDTALLPIVAQVAIAARCKPPEVFLLRHDQRANGFVVGSFKGDNALVLTQGALEQLTREEVSALVAHEFAHIARRDVPVQMVLLTGMQALTALNRIGRRIKKNTGYRPRRHPRWWIGSVVRLAGQFGVLASEVLPWAIQSNQRQLDTDAHAIEYLSSPLPFNRALTSLQRQTAILGPLQGSNAQAMKPLCFHGGTANVLSIPFRFAHPTLQERQDALNDIVLPTEQPVFAAQKESRSATERTDAVAKAPVHHTSPSPSKAAAERYAEDTLKPGSNAPEDRLAGVIPVPKNAALKEFASRFVSFTPQSGAVQTRRKNTVPLPVTLATSALLSERGAMMIGDSNASLVALFALFLPAQHHAKTRYLHSVTFAYSQYFADEVSHYHQFLHYEMTQQRLGVVHTAAQCLRGRLKDESIRGALFCLERLLKSQGLYDLESCAALCYLRGEVQADFPILMDIADAEHSHAAARKVSPTSSLSGELSLLMSVVMHECEFEVTRADAEHQRILSEYTDTLVARRTEFTAEDSAQIENAFTQLMAQPTEVRESFARHCAHVGDLSRGIRRNKQPLVNMLCATLIQWSDRADDGFAVPKLSKVS